MYLEVFLLALLRLGLRAFYRVPASSRWTALTTQPPCEAVAIGTIATLPIAFGLQLWLVSYMAQHQLTSCYHSGPFPVVSDLSPTMGGAAELWPSLAIVAIAGAQCALLFAVNSIFARNSSPIKTTLLVIACSVMVLQAIFAGAMTSPDAYSYVTYSQMGFASYVPSLNPIGIGHFFVWCSGFIPAAYGPGFIAYVELLLHFFHSSALAVLALRLANAGWFLCVIWLVRAARVSQRVVALTALNPALLFQYVANAHNDIIAVVLVVAAILLAKRSAGGAAILVIVAALVKLPFALIGTLAFVRIPNRAGRVWISFATIGASIILSYALAGPGYFATLAAYHRFLFPDADKVGYVVSAAAFVALTYALLCRRFNQTLTYAFPALAVLTQPWYFVWSLPYAVCKRRYLPTLLILAPFAAVLMEDGISHTALLAAYAAACLAIGGGMIIDLRAAISRRHLRDGV